MTHPDLAAIQARIHKSSLLLAGTHRILASANRRVAGSNGRMTEAKLLELSVAS